MQNEQPDKRNLARLIQEKKESGTIERINGYNDSIPTLMPTKQELEGQLADQIKKAVEHSDKVIKESDNFDLHRRIAAHTMVDRNIKSICDMLDKGYYDNSHNNLDENSDFHRLREILMLVHGKSDVQIL